MGLGLSPLTLAMAAIASVWGHSCAAQVASDVPPSFVDRTDIFDYAQRAFDIPMRDGVTLHTTPIEKKGRPRSTDPPRSYAV